MIATAFSADSLSQTLARGLFALFYGTALAASGCAIIAGAYLVKSALGINLMPGPSPLHDLLFPLISGQ